MSIKVEKTENANEMKLTFNISAEVFEEGMKKVYVKTAKYFNIPGFRKGKAPMSLVEKTYGSQIFYEDTFNEIVPEIFDKEVKVNEDAVLSIASVPNIATKELSKEYWLRRLLQSSDSSYKDISKVEFFYDELTGFYKITYSVSGMINKIVFKEMESSFLIISLAVYQNSYDSNTLYFDKIIKSVKIN